MISGLGPVPNPVLVPGRAIPRSGTGPGRATSRSRAGPRASDPPTPPPLPGVRPPPPTPGPAAPVPAHRLSRGRARSRRTPGASAALMAGGGGAAGSPPPPPPAVPFHRPAGPAAPRPGPGPAPGAAPRSPRPVLSSNGGGAKPELPLRSRLRLNQKSDFKSGGKEGKAKLGTGEGGQILKGGGLTCSRYPPAGSGFFPR